jgi:ubiquinone/menaquinone biosynthesis C-methylase UbiE
MSDILMGRTTSLDLLTSDGTLADMYDGNKTPSMTGITVQLGKVMNLIGHKHPGMNILEVGAGTGSATKVALESLCALPIDSTRRYTTYTFTDISPSFFPAAEEAFASYPGLSYKLLDIEGNIEKQAFVEQSYDLIISSNVVHATRIDQSLENLKRLLKPGGKLVLLEVTREPLGIGMLFVSPSCISHHNG